MEQIIYTLWGQWNHLCWQQGRGKKRERNICSFVKLCYSERFCQRKIIRHVCWGPPGSFLSPPVWPWPLVRDPESKPMCLSPPLKTWLPFQVPSQASEDRRGKTVQINAPDLPQLAVGSRGLAEGCPSSPLHIRIHLLSAVPLVKAAVKFTYFLINCPWTGHLMFLFSITANCIFLTWI